MRLLRNFERGFRARRLNLRGRVCRLEPLETRALMSVTTGTEETFSSADVGGLTALGAEAAPVIGISDETALGFDEDTSSYAIGSASNPLGDATPTGTRYLVTEAWGGSWCDAEKSPTNDDDDYLCWAGTASNVLAWTGWGLVDGLTNTDQIFQYFQQHWSDQGGLMQYGWEWWFDGTNGAQGYDGWAQVEVAGGSFYPNESISNYFRASYSTDGAMAAIDEYLHDGCGVGIGIYGDGAHAITVWGYNCNPDNPSEYLGIWVTDSDDAKGTTSPPDHLRYYEVAYGAIPEDDGGGNGWFLQNYYGTYGWYIGAVQGLERATPATPTGIDGTVFDDANGDGTQQEGEAGLAGQTVYLDANNNGIYDHSVFTQSTPTTIPDNTTVTSTLTVTGIGSISDVNVRLNITHTWDSDLDVSLISPTGTRVALFALVGGNGEDFSDTLLDDEAETAIADGAAPFSGSYRPEEPLSTFDGELADGVWTLEVTDIMPPDPGVLNSWSLEFGDVEQSTVTAADGSYSFRALEAGTYHVRVDLSDGQQCTTPADGEQYVTLVSDTVVANVDFGITEDATPSATELGTVDYLALADLNPAAGDLWYHFQATRAGWLTLQTVALSAGVSLELYNNNYQQLAVSAVSGDAQRIDQLVGAGESYYLRVTGTAGDVDLKIANLVSQVGTAVTVFATAADDRFDFAAAAYHQITINGVEYEFNSAEVSSVVFQGGGEDTAVLVGSTGNDTATLHPNTVTLSGGGYQVDVSGTQDIIVLGGGGSDLAYLYDSSGDDTFTATTSYAQLAGTDYFCRVETFATVHAIASSGTDTAYLYDSAGADSYEATSTWARLYGTGFFYRAKSFDNVHAYSSGGSDVARFYDSAGNDLFEAKLGSWARMTGTGFFRRAVGFATNYAIGGSGGTDRASLADSTSDDRFTASPTQADFTNSSYTIQVQTFAKVQAYSTSGGTDTAGLTDSASVDTFWASPTKAYLSGTGFWNEVNNFKRVRADSIRGGADTAYLYDSTGNDTLVTTSTYAKLYGDNFLNMAATFRYAHAYATGGTDTATMFDSAGNDTFDGYATMSRMYGANYFNRAMNFETVTAIRKNGGTDQANLYDSSASDRLTGNGQNVTLQYAAALVQASSFPSVRAVSQSGGSDTKHIEAVDLALQTVGVWTDV